MQYLCSGDVDAPVEEDWRGIPVIRFPGQAPFGARRRRALRRRYWPALYRWLRMNVSSYDIVHCHGAFDPSSLPVAFGGRLAGRPTDLTPIAIPAPMLEQTRYSV